MQTDNVLENAPDTLREIDDDAIAEQMSRIAAAFDLSYDELVAAFRGKR